MKLFTLAVATLISTAAFAEIFSLKSPDKKSELIFNWENSQLSYQLKNNGKTLIDSSNVSLETGKKFTLARMKSLKMILNGLLFTVSSKQFATVTTS